MMTDGPSSPAVCPPMAPRRRSVLVLEDDPDAALVLKDLIEDQGYLAICVGNGRDGLSMLEKEKERPCLLLIDVFMPVLNGVEFLRIVRGNDKLCHIPCVLMTAANDRMIGVKEDVSVLYKPVDLEGLKRILEKACDATATPPRAP